MKATPEIIRGIKPEDYHALKRERDAISYSQLKLFYKNPWRYHQGIPEKESDSMSFGTLFDYQVMIPEQMEDRYAVSPYDAFRSNESKLWKAEQEAAGRLVCKEKDLAKSKAAVRALKPDTLRPFEGAAKSVGVFAKLPGTPFEVCCLLDCVPHAAGEFGHALLDLKTSKAPDPDDYPREIVTYKYHWQAAMYLDVWNAVSGERRTDFLHAVVENSEPFENGLIHFDPYFIDMGRREYVWAMRRLARCIESDTWPSPFDDGPVTVMPPKWYTGVDEAIAQ